eukprot:5085948-Prymnesium_polylepis.1
MYGPTIAGAEVTSCIQCAGSVSRVGSSTRRLDRKTASASEDKFAVGDQLNSNSMPTWRRL